MPVREYDASANDEGDNIHVRIRIDRGEVVDFAAIYEVLVDGEFHAAVRHDASHGVAHRDLLDWDGRKVRTDQLFPGMTLSEALNAAIQDIYERWPIYRSRLLRSRR